MSEWKAVKLKDVVSILGDGLHGTPIYNNIGEYFFINGNNLSEGHIVIKNDTKRVDFLEYDKYKKDLNDRTLLVSINGTIGNVATYKGEKCILGKSACYFNILPGVCKEYIYYILLHDNFQSYAKNWATGTTIKNVSLKQMREYEFLLPSFDKQQQIAKILSSLDDKIELNTQINHNLEEQAALIFADWLQGCNESVAIGDLSTNILDYTPINNGFVRLLNSSDVTEGVFPDIQLVPNANLKGHFKKRFQLGDILYSEIRPRNHHYGFVLFDASEYIASTRLMVIRALDYKVSPAMLYQYLLLPNVEAEFTLKTESRSGTFPQGNYADMASIKIPYAPVKAQNEVSSTLTKIRQTIANNQLENRQLFELRDALLPKLMSGEIDVSEVEV